MLRAALIAAVAVLSAPAPGVAAGCPADATCTQIAVPLDHSGATPGTLPLAYARVAATGTRTGTIVFLSGGPGQAAIPLTADVAQVLEPLRSHYDLVLPDQRGTGRSGATSCTLDRVADVPPCAAKLGAKRPFLNTTETALDVEDLRQALGVDKLTLLGVSYGTKVAGEYARRFPQHTAAVVLDSPVSVDGLDGLDRLPVLGAPRVLREVCYPGACHRTVRDPKAALDAAAKRLRQGALTTPLVAPSGRVRHVKTTEAELFAALGASDLSPLLRVRLPAAIASLAAGDGAPLEHTLALLGAGAGPTSDAAGINGARLLATDCLESHLPWAPDSPPQSRGPALQSFLAGLGPAPFAPFAPATVLAGSAAELCTAWPATPAPQGVPSAGPDVPVLVLSGRDDLRTPTEDARRTAAEFPHAQLLAVPDVGHSVLSTDLSGCAIAGLRSFLAARPIVACSQRPTDTLLRDLLAAFLAPAAYIPADLSRIAPLGLPGRPGRTLDALKLTLRQVSADALLSFGQSSGRHGVRIPGLRAGYALITNDGLVLHGVEVIRGVRVSGTLRNDAGTLAVSGPAASPGVLTVSGNVLAGTIGGRPVDSRRMSLD